ncbi:MAG: hypothetical protein RDV48_18915 [Candidatus Eremiobacteraeota bacterium]|nr:hypothetical protein [Candidatus Eremiobacteraeota bacterium]
MSAQQAELKKEQGRVESLSERHQAAGEKSRSIRSDGRERCRPGDLLYRCWDIYVESPEKGFLRL